MITAIASVITIAAFIYGMVRNFKMDIGVKFDRMEQRIDQLEGRMFLLSTGKTLSQAILEEKMKEQK